ncbi:MAG: TonB-dependent receptor, partial [Acidobacteriota bacterium]
DLLADDDWTDWSGRLSLAHQTRPDLLLFATVSRGFKSGGFNGRPQQRQVLDPFDPEIVVGYELGFKGDFNDRKVRLNGSAFFSDYQDIHFAASLDVNGLPVFVTQNAGDAEIWGFELELQSYLSDTVFLLATLSHLDNRLTSLDPRVPASGVDLDDRLPRTPEWSYSLALQSSQLVDDRGLLIARVDWAWRDDYFQDFANNPGIVQEAFGLLSARLSWTPLSERWSPLELALFGTNLTDEAYLESGFVAGAFGVNLGIAADPRLWGVEATWRF